MEIFFISSNENKRREVCAFLNSENLTVRMINRKLAEIQSADMAAIAEDKALRGFEEVWRPVLVEQTGLLITGFGGLPGGFTQSFWDILGADLFCRSFAALAQSEVVAKSVFAYCDGQRIRIFEGETRGYLVNPPRGEFRQSWDCVFLPAGQTKTLAEMPEQEQNRFSMRKAALKALKRYLNGVKNETIDE